MEKVSVEKEKKKVEDQFADYDSRLKKLTKDEMDSKPVLETEPQTKLSQRQIAESNDVYLKPIKSIGSSVKFNENFREKWNFAKEYVYFIAENNEIIGTGS